MTDTNTQSQPVAYLTGPGKRAVNEFLASLKAQRKYVLANRLDTADETPLADVQAILDDIPDMVMDDGTYVNNWPVSDSMDSAEPLELMEGIDFFLDEA